MGCNTRGQTSEDEIEQIRSHREAVFRAHIYLNVLAIFREITSIDPEVKFLALCVFFFFTLEAPAVQFLFLGMSMLSMKNTLHKATR